MKKKILFFDIDGTLLGGGVKGYIPESAMKALKRAQENGHYLFINSGRTSGFLPQPIREFPFDGYLCGCGIEVIFHGESIYHNVIPEEATTQLFKALKETGVQALLEGPNACYCDFEAGNLFPPLQGLADTYQHLDSPYPLYSFSKSDLLYDKFVVFYDDTCKFDLFLEMTKEYFEYIPREDMGAYHFAEFAPAGHSKATAMDYIVNYLGLSMDDTYAFGDSNNDLLMLSHAKHSIAMGNSYPEVFPMVNYITTPINRDGIELALKHYKLI